MSLYRAALLLRLDLPYLRPVPCKVSARLDLPLVADLIERAAPRTVVRTVYSALHTLALPERTTVACIHTSYDRAWTISSVYGAYSIQYSEFSCTVSKMHGKMYSVRSKNVRDRGRYKQRKKSKC